MGTIVILAAMAIFTLYIGIIIDKYGLPSSVSETFYLLPVGSKWLFTAMCWAVCAVIVPWMDRSPEDLQFLGFLSIIGLLVVGTAAPFKKDFVHSVHYWAAGICAGASQLWIFLATNLWWVSLACFIIAGGFWFWDKFRRTTFWAEMWAFVSLFVSLVIVQ